MIDLLQAAQDAVYAALAAAISGTPVYQHTRQNTQPPFVKIGAIDSDNEAGKGNQFEKLTVEIQCVTRGEERGPLLTLMHGVRQALDDQAISAAGVDFHNPRFVTASASDASPVDGLTYAGIVSFEIYAQPAD